MSIDPERIFGGPAMNEMEPIQRRTLHDEVVTRIRDMIIEGTLGAGERINEALIGKRLGVSRTPMREAIKTLASEGLIDVLPAKGAVVHTVSEQSLLETLEALKILEQAAGRLACSRASDETLNSINQIHVEMMTLYRDETRLEYFKLNQAIHAAIVAAGGNGLIARAHASLQARIKRFRFVGNREPAKWSAAVGEHEEMIAALMARDGDALAEVLGRHLDAAFVRVRYLFGQP
jgi:DNA-binding GntR family transcriptional regulator